MLPLRIVMVALPVVATMTFPVVETVATDELEDE